MDEQARCLRPDKNPAADWRRAADLYERAAALHEMAKWSEECLE